jgi:hypothetical protein
MAVNNNQQLVITLNCSLLIFHVFFYRRCITETKMYFLSVNSSISETVCINIINICYYYLFKQYLH